MYHWNQEVMTQPMFPNVTCVMRSALIIATWLSMCSTGAQQAVPSFRPLNVAYDAELEHHTGNSITRVHLLYDRGRFRQEMRFPGSPPTKKPMYMQICDGNRPYIAWSCSLSGRTAWPLPEACQQALSRAVRREGEAIVRQRYHVPANFPLTVYANDKEPPHPSMALKTKNDLLLNNVRLVGTETIAGYACQIYESSATQRIEASRDGVAGSQMLHQSRTVRAWVEPRTGLVLRLENREQPPPGSPAPPTSRGYVVKTLRLPAAIPVERFQIPSGIRVYVAKLFSDVKLPRGVKRMQAMGKAADVGMILE